MMIRALMVLSTIVMSVPLPGWADIFDDIGDMRAQVAAARAAHDAKLSYNAAPATLAVAFEAQGVDWAQRYLADWGSWLFVDWDHANTFHDRADETLRAWQGALHAGPYDHALVSAALSEGMRAFHQVDGQMHGWFDAYIANQAEKARLLDRSHAAHLAGNQELADYYTDLANHVHDGATYPSPNEMGAIVVLPMVPDAEGRIVTGRDWAYDLANRSAEHAVTTGDPIALRRALTEARRVEARYPSDTAQELVQVLQLLEQRTEFQNNPIIPLLNQAEVLAPGPLRDALLDAAQWGLLDRMGHLAPLIATDADQDQTLSDLATMAQRIVMLRDDLADPISPPSELLRSVNGLKAAAGLLELAQSDDPRAKDIMGVINDAAGTSPAILSPTAPFAAPAGIVTAQLDQTRQAWDHASDAMQGVADAIGGDVNGIARAEAAADRLRASLDPRAFARNMADGFVDGVVSNVPFARSIVAWLRE